MSSTADQIIKGDPAVDPEFAAVGHHPYVAPSRILPELAPGPLIVGVVLGIVFGASSLYLALKVGMTVSASIPVAVLSITIFRWLAKAFNVRPATILENNIVQTTGSAGESIAFGVAVTMPAIMILGYDLELARVMVVASLGGLLGILMMIPLRRGLVVKNHGKLAFPEGTACAEVLIAGEKGGTEAKTVFTGFGIAVAYKFLMSGTRVWKDTVDYALGFFRGGTVSCEVAPELVGVGYIIGPRIASIMVAGGVLASLVLIPAIKLFGDGLTEPLFPGTIPIKEMATHGKNSIWGAYVLYIGAGAVAAGGIISLIREFPTIAKAIYRGLSGMGLIRTSVKAIKGEMVASAPAVVFRTSRDLPWQFVAGGCALLVVAITAAPMLRLNVLGAMLILAFGFLFVMVSSRLTGEIGSSSNPISGMTVATLLLTCLIFLALGWTGPEYRVTALSIAAVVCVAASNGGTTAQDLKTGFLVGATPRFQQTSILIGALTSALVIGGILLLLNDASTVYARPFVKRSYDAKIDTSTLKERQKLFGVAAKTDSAEYFVYKVEEKKDGIPAGRYLVDDAGKIQYAVTPGVSAAAFKMPASAEKQRLTGPDAKADANEYFVLRLTEPTNGTAPGKYLVDGDGNIAYLADPGINGVVPERDDGSNVVKYNAPKARLMSLIIDGILTQKLPWALVLLGVFIAIVLELCRVSSLAFAVGVYLPLSASMPIFIGGLVRWFVDRGRKGETAAEAESSPAVLMSSGYIAGGSIAGILLALVALSPGVEKALDFSGAVGPTIADSNITPLIPFAFMVFALYAVGRGWFLKARG
ncbi:MAG: oligopeptide transporter, OPT family [Deltaproteobacteria bacterium]|nr:oligopeptide transporter, OPT family [Deltaproteobacteria bacterium]